MKSSIDSALNSGAKAATLNRGIIIEYTIRTIPLVLPFLFNPSTLTRTRSVTVKSGGAEGARGGYSFSTPDQTPRASQGVTVNAESFSFKILLDATDRMQNNDPVARVQGVQPEIDVIRTMLEPKSHNEPGMRDLKIASKSETPAHQNHEFASVLIFKWGVQLIPVFMTQAQVEVQEFLSAGLYPYRAEATLTLQVIETDNPLYNFEKIRQQAVARAYSVGAGLPRNIIPV